MKRKTTKRDNKKEENKKRCAQERHIIPNTVAHHALTDAHPVPEAQSAPPRQLPQLTY